MMDNFKVIIVEDVPLELKGTEGIFKNENSFLYMSFLHSVLLLFCLRYCLHLI